MPRSAYWARGKPIPPKTRWLSHVGPPDPITGCTEWTASRLRYGYGNFRYQGAPSAHRAGWLLFRGPIPAGMCVLHICDNPPCVNLDHLYLGTQKDNAQDAMARGRYRNSQAEKTHCKRGHEFTLENTARTVLGHRRCRECRKIRG